MRALTFKKLFANYQKLMSPKTKLNGRTLKAYRCFDSIRIKDGKVVSFDIWGKDREPIAVGVTPRIMSQLREKVNAEGIENAKATYACIKSLFPEIKF